MFIGTYVVYLHTPHPQLPFLSPFPLMMIQPSLPYTFMSYYFIIIIIIILGLVSQMIENMKYLALGA
jgi:hypothetical protein